MWCMLSVSNWLACTVSTLIQEAQQRGGECIEQDA
jgi:hypothetical protein